MEEVIIFIVSITLIIGVGKYILIDYSYIPKNPQFSIDLEKVRSLLGSPKNRPLEINCLFTGTGALIPWTIAAGDRSIPNDYVPTSFQIVYSDKTILIDTPMGKKLFTKFKYSKKFNEKNYLLFRKGMEDAHTILFTHEHWDHTGGLSKSPYVNKYIKKTVFTKEQIESRLIKKAEFPEETFKTIKPIQYEHYLPVLPGIVLIKAPGHTPGHQWIFVSLKNGNEYLFIGDTVWNFAAIKKNVPRPLLVYLFGGENPFQVGNQIQWLSKLFYDEKNEIYLIPNHDPELLKGYMQKGILGQSFKILK